MMRDVFRDSKAFNQPLYSWDVRNVERMNGAIAYNQNLDAWSIKQHEVRNKK
jgi:hypothetical protein